MELNREIAVIVTDAAGHVLEWNRAAQRLYGWRETEAKGRNIVELTPSHQSRAEADAIMSILREGDAWEGEIVLRAKDGSRFRAYVRNYPVGDFQTGSGVIVGFSTPIDSRRLLDDNDAAIQADVAVRAARARDQI